MFPCGFSHGAWCLVMVACACKLVGNKLRIVHIIHSRTAETIAGPDDGPKIRCSINPDYLDAISALLIFDKLSSGTFLFAPE